ncbi:MAG: prolyl oligopeptidase family serine peptidase [Bryobacterales bacterium]|nr:prolyl oligopeptidase family serine peptidase [Bryobacterales bacterium]
MENMIGAWGEWAAKLASDPPRLSFRRSDFNDLDAWRTRARARYRESLLQPNLGGTPQANVQRRWEYDGLAIEHVTWQLPVGPMTEGVVLKPANASGKLPAVLALHDHGGNKYFGYRKITNTSNDPHPMMVKHQEHYYGGAAWANELAKRGYVVLVHDTFTFGSRRMRAADLPARIKGDWVEQNPEAQDEIDKYNRFAGNHEHLVAKSLFCAGTTWPGMFVTEDQKALDYLCSRPDVDPNRVGCGGLSGGGLRTVFLTGADERIKCATPVGMMTTWRDYLLHKAYTHTWMCYIPGLPNDLDYPEILALTVPNPVMVLMDRQDQLFTEPEMERAGKMIEAIYRKAKAADRVSAKFYPGPHKFDLEMQKDAFTWFDKWLKG